MLWSIDTTHSLCLCVWVCVSKFLFLIGIICYESESEVTQLCLTLCHPMDCSLPVSSVHGIFQARTLEWVAIIFSRRSSQPRDWSQVSHIVGRRFTIWATRKVDDREKKSENKRDKNERQIHCSLRLFLGLMLQRQPLLCGSDKMCLPNLSEFIMIKTHLTLCYKIWKIPLLPFMLFPHFHGFSKYLFVKFP